MVDGMIDPQDVHAKALLVMERWRKDPVAFVNEAIGYEGYAKKMGYGKITNQQKHALKELGKLSRAKIASGLGVELTPSEKEYSEKVGISIRAGQGPGKTTVMSWAMIWYLNCFSNAICPAVAPTGAQLKTGLWKEIGIWLQVMEEFGSPLVRGKLVIQTDKIYHVDHSKRKESWAALARTAKDTSDVQQQGLTLRGMHGPNMMICLDEASGLSDGVFEPLQGTLTDPHNFVFMIFNPIKKTGYAAETQLRNKKHWIALHWSNEDCERILPSKIAKSAETYGRDSDFFRVNVLGEFPVQGGDTFIPLQYIEDAFNRDIIEDKDAPVFLGIDPAWTGRDQTVFCRRQGGVVGPIIAKQGLLTTETARWVQLNQSEIKADAICIDVNGIGGGVCDIMREMRLPVYAIQTANNHAQNKEKFGDLRSELIWNLRDWFMEGRITIRLDHHNLNDDAQDMLKRRLIEELSILRYTSAAQGKIKFESKEVIKKKLGRSCDLLDALCYSFFFSDGAFSRKGLEDPYTVDWEGTQDDVGWMSI